MKKVILLCLLGMIGILGCEYELWGYKDLRKQPYALFFLDTKDPKEIDKTIKFIKNKGGDVGIIGREARVILGRLDRKIAPHLIGKYHIIDIYFEYLDPSLFVQYGEETVKAIYAWNNILEGEGLMPTPVLLSPKNQEKIEGMFIDFSWQTPLSKVRIQISKDLSFRDCVVDTIIKGKSYKFVSHYLDEGKYYWRVQVLNREEKANSAFTNPWCFIIATSSLNSIPPPALKLPTNTSSFWPYGKKPRPLFCWDSVEEALGYRIQVSDDNEFKKTTIDLIIIGTITCNPKDGGEYHDGDKYYWRVSSFNEKGKGSWSDVWSFYVKAPPLGDCTNLPIPNFHHKKTK